MERAFIENQKYIKAKKRVKKIKGFSTHFAVYIVVNIFLSGIIIFGLTSGSDNEYNFLEALRNFGVYSTWLFWGIGLFFHWLGAFVSNVLFCNNWKMKQLAKYMDDTM